MHSAEKVRGYLRKGYLIGPDIIEEPYAELLSANEDQLVLFRESLAAALASRKLDWVRVEEAKADQEKGKGPADSGLFVEQPSASPEPRGPEPAFEVKVTYPEMKKKKTIEDFFSYYVSRYKQLSAILRQREELKTAVSIRRAKARPTNESVTIIGMVREKRTTKNDNLFLVLEDQTDTLNVVLSKNRSAKQDGDDRTLFEEAQDICLDEVLGVIGSKADGDMVFATNILWPDVPLTKEYKKSPTEEYAVFIGDTHFGSKHFLDKEFKMFLDWLTGKAGAAAQKELASKVKYLFIVGDLVEGIGIYPRQEEDLAVKNIYEQYSLFAGFLKQIPKHITIFVAPGNHDAIRVHEPQPPIYAEFAQELYGMDNVVFVSSPAEITIGKAQGFAGIDVLLYHGYSFPFYADSVESIRQKGGLERTDLILKYLLKRRHLAPEHGSNQFVPDFDFDPMVISSTPDIIVTGHIHRATATKYRNTTLLNCSCWIGQTEYQEKRGIKPQPGKAITMNLATREVRIMNFMR